MTGESSRSPTRTIENFKQNGLWAKTRTENGVLYNCMSFSVWCSMRHRCVAGGKLQAKSKNYVGCAMSELFKDYQSFTDWHVEQIGFGIPGYQLDKDLLVPHNKLYSENTCVLLPGAFNSFLAFGSERSELPPGVSKSLSKFRAKAFVLGVSKNLGTYATKEAAFTAYCEAKNGEAAHWLRVFKRGGFPVDDKVVTALREFDYKNYANFKIESL